MSNYGSTHFPHLNYNIKDAVIDDQVTTAPVTFISKKLHSLSLASSVRTVLTELIDGIDNLDKYNQATSSETSTDKTKI